MKRWILYLVTIAVCFFTGGCILDEDVSDGDENGALSARGLFIFESDFQSGMLECMDVDSANVSPMELPVFNDAVLRSYHGAVYVLERLGADNIMKIDPAKRGEDAVIYQRHLSNKCNPYDIAFLSDTKAYVANQNAPEILIVNPQNGSAEKSIGLETYIYMPENNTSPYANRMAVVGSVVYVTLQRRNGFNPGAPTLIIPIDSEKDSIMEEDTVRCTFSNNNDMVAVEGKLFCTNPGNAMENDDGGIEVVDCATGEVSTILTEEQLGGNPNQIIHKGGNRFYVQVYAGWTDVKVVEIDAAEKKIVETLPDIHDAFGGISYDASREQLYVGERDASGIGILVFRNNRKAGGPYRSPTSLPPSCLVLVE